LYDFERARKNGLCLAVRRTGPVKETRGLMRAREPMQYCTADVELGLLAPDKAQVGLGLNG
jgi:hypothetical protein